MAPAAREVFVGRARELEELQAALADARTGRGRLVLLVGEPGIGKTRLADEFASVARQRGVQVLWGRCWEGEGAPAFWPWVQIVRAYMQYGKTDAWLREMGTGASDIAQVVPAVREWLPDLPLSPDLEPGQARFRLFDSMTTFLKNAGKGQPLALLLDDLHWADKPSLLLLSFLTRELHDARLLVIGTYRNVEVGREHPLAETLGELARESQRVVLHGLSEEDIARFIESTTDTTPAANLIKAVHDKTDGNPFFVSEIVHMLDAEGRLQESEGKVSQSLSIPQGVRETIHHRLGRLSKACHDLLMLAAVIGREFGLDLLGRLSGQGRGTQGGALLEWLDEALAALIVDELPGRAGRYRFTHALIRETLYEDLSIAKRVRLHRQVGKALEAQYGPHRIPHVAELAFHFFEAAWDGRDVDKALDYAQQAGEQALGQLAYEEAASHYERALRVLEHTDPDDARRCHLLLALGDARMRAGERRQARETFRAAADIATTLDMPEQVARAALGFGGRGDAATRFDADMVNLLEAALAALPAADSVLRVRVLGRLAMALYFSNAEERRAALSREAVAMARRVNDLPTLAYALSASHFALWGPDNLEERLATANEIVSLAEQAGAKEIAIGGYFWRLLDLLERGDIAALDRDLHAHTRLAEELRQPFYRWRVATLQAMRALLDGRLADGEQLIHEAFRLGQETQTPNAFLVFAVQLFGLRRDQGRLQELEDVLKDFVERYPTIPAFRTGLAYLYTELGREAEARVVFDQLAQIGFANWPRDGTWLNVFDELAQVCAFLRDTDRARELYALLLPYAGRNVVISFADACDGAVAHYLGLLAATLSRWEEAVEHFDAALEMNLRMGALPFVTRTQYAYARMLLARGQPGDRERAFSFLHHAFNTAQELGMLGLLEKIKALREEVAEDRERVAAPERGAVREPSRPAESSIFRQEGTYWTLGYNGTTVRLKNTKGLSYIACLLQRPGQEFHVFDLLALTDKRPDTSTSGVSRKHMIDHNMSISFPSDASPLPDPQAREAYKRRLTDLRDEVEEAERFNDPDRAAKAQAEIDFLTNELATSYGLSRHAHQRSETVEKARKAVTNRIRVSLAQIKKAHPILWQHLFASIKTGTFCSYNPAQPTTWQA